MGRLLYGAGGLGNPGGRGGSPGVGYCGTANPGGSGGMLGNPRGGRGIKLDGDEGGKNPAGGGGGIGAIGYGSIEGGSNGWGCTTSADKTRATTWLEWTHLALYRGEDPLA